MIILDTNIVSELLRQRPARAVLDWWGTVAPQETYLTSVTRAEIRYGIARMPGGARRDAVVAAAARHLDEAADRTLAFDNAAADEYGDVVADRERAGQPISHQDAQIAAIARARRAAVATRDVGGFAGTGVRVIDPFTP